MTESEAETEVDDSPLQVLLVEDNPGDARYIQEMFKEAGELSQRVVAQRAGEVAEQSVESSHGNPSITHVTRLADGLERLGEESFDVVLLDLNLPDSNGLDTIDTLRRETTSVPVLVLTGVRDRKTGLEALQQGAEEYLVKDEVNADLLVRSVYHAIERKNQEHELERQRNQLATLNSLNELVHAITASVLDSTTREEIEQQVCDYLTNSDSYQFAWFGEIAPDGETVVMRTEAGGEGYLDDITIEVSDSDRGRGPTGRAIRTGEVQIAQNIPENPQYEPWQEHAKAYGYRSSASIPVEYEETLYGVLNLYSSRPNAFEPDERAVVGRLGEVIGHAINSIERKQALISEDVVELQFRVENAVEAPASRANTDYSIDFERVIPVSDDVYLMYGTVTGDAVDVLESLVEQLSHFESVKMLDDAGGTRRFELRLTEPPVISTIASHGGRVKSASIENGDYRLVVQAPPSIDVRRLVDAVQALYPNASLQAQRQKTRTEQSETNVGSNYLEGLTKKQRAAIESAYVAGFFEWPREVTGEEMAESMDVSPPTYHQHIRTAERKLLEEVFDSEE